MLGTVESKETRQQGGGEYFELKTNGKNKENFRGGGLEVIGF
jgi:hypothetical protein